jgi:DNA-binding MarR family transcriptional regulator
LLESIVQGSVGLTARVITSTAPELTLFQWRVLVVVGDSAQGVSIALLSDQIGASSSATSRLVSRMVANGFVETRKSPGDRRVTNVVLSRKGARLRGRIQGTRRLLLGPIAARLGESGTLEQLALAFAEFD